MNGQNSNKKCFHLKSKILDYKKNCRQGASHVNRKKTKTELQALSRSFIIETDATNRPELKLLFIREKTLEIRDAWNNFNDNSQQQSMDELEKNFKTTRKGLFFTQIFQWNIIEATVHRRNLNSLSHHPIPNSHIGTAFAAG